MSDEKSKPTHEAFSVRNYEKEGKQDASWLKVGVAFTHKDGDGFDVILDAVPVTGRIVLRKVKSRSAAVEG